MAESIDSKLTNYVGYLSEIIFEEILGDWW